MAARRPAPDHRAPPPWPARTSYGAKFGVTSTQSIEIRFDRIETVRVKQSLMGRILNYGDIVVTGTGSTFDPIPNISKPMKFRAALNDAMEATRPVAGSTRL